MFVGQAGLYELALEHGVRLRDEAAAERLARVRRLEREVVTMSDQERDLEQPLREWARERVESGRRLRLRIAAFALGMAVLTPVWAIGEYLGSGGWPKRLSPNDNPGDWSPWIIWVALAWGFFLALNAIAIHLRRPVDEREIERELERLARQT